MSVFNTTGLAFGSGSGGSSSNPTLQNVLTNGNTSVNLNLDLTNGSLISNSVYTNTVNSINAGNLTLNSTSGLVYMFAQSSPSGSIFLEAFSSIGITATTDSIAIQTGEGSIGINSHSDLSLIAGNVCNLTATTFNIDALVNITAGKSLRIADALSFPNLFMDREIIDLTDATSHTGITANSMTIQNSLQSLQLSPTLIEIIDVTNTTSIGAGAMNIESGSIATLISPSIIQLNDPTTTTTLTGVDITSGAFIKTGGTATQYLMADGSVTSQASITTATVSIVAIPLTPSMNLSTIIFTNAGGAIQNFTSAGLIGLPSGYTIYLRNGTATDITLQIGGFPVGTLYKPTGSNNSSFVLLFWNGASLIAFL